MTRHIRRGIVIGLVAALATGAAVALAVEREKTPSPDQVAPAPKENSQVAYLGVEIEPLYAPLVSHMPKLLSNGQGVLVASVAPKSPAKKAGIQAHDILMRYGDQRLFSPEQLAKLVKTDETGREVTLQLIRNGELKDLNVKLGQREVGTVASAPSPKPEREWWAWRSPRWREHMPHWFTRSTGPNEKESEWESFDSMTIKKLDDNRFQAQIQYLDKEGKVRRQTFEGTRDEVHKAIVAQKDLPATERQQLLRSLDMPADELEFSGVEMIPGFGLVWTPGDPDRSL